jgi:LL-diaminopimelate aminotransferase
MRNIYQERRDVFVEGLIKLGWKVKKPAATFYIWAGVPTNESSVDFSRRLLKEADIVAAPGVGFGRFGEGYVRFALTVSKERLVEALRRIKKII